MASLGAGFGQLARAQASSAGPLSHRGCCFTQGLIATRCCSRSSRLVSPSRNFASSSGGSGKRPKFSHRLRDAMRNTKVQWYQIPVGLGVGFLGLVQFYKVSAREQEKSEKDEFGSPSKRPRITPEGPWQVRVMSTLPLKAISRLWGKFNELTIPYYLRVPGFKLYSFIFGVNLSEVGEDDLHVYPNLASFFYRKLKPGSRPLHPDPHMLLSPSDGKVLQFGQIEGGDIEQVKGMTYSVDALLGKHTPSPSVSGASTTDGEGEWQQVEHANLHKDESLVKQEEEFAQVNGISYTLPDIMSGPDHHVKNKKKAIDQSTTPSSASAVSEVGAELALGEKPWYDILSDDKKTSLYYAVVYLAPGDYHRFHSPTNWVCERRRHFPGELYSVSPYLQRTLPGLFTLNERVVLLGRWRYGFFSYIPVGATNVGSIIVNFDRELRTNSLTTDTAADRAAEDAKKRGEQWSGFVEATYEKASPVLGGHAIRKGDEMGGFQLGSTIVLVFEAPSEDHGGWKWMVEKGQKVQMGQALGKVIEDA